MTYRLGPDDSILMRKINALFATAFEPVDNYPPDQPDDNWLVKRLADPHIIAVAASDHGELIGGLSGYILPKLEQNRSEIYIYDLAVAKTYRRKGVATALISEVKNIARQTGSWVIFVQADYGDDPAIALYTKLGTREDVLHFDIAP